MRMIILLAAAALLAACSSPESKAVAACKAEIGRKVDNSNFSLDEADMAAKATREGADVVRIQSGITFDPGRPNEIKQTFDCRVRLGDSDDVISLQFIW